MKNKRLIATLLILFLLVIFAIAFKKDRLTKDMKDQKVIRVGILQLVTHQALDQIEKGIEDELKASLPADKKVKISLMNAEGDQSKLQTMSRQLVSSGNDIVVGIATPAAQGLAAASKDIPVVMSAVSDPIGAKLVTNLKKPEANVTGLSNKLPLKQTLDLIKDLTPTVKTIGLLYASNEDNSLLQVNDFAKLAEARGYVIKKYAVPSTNEVSSTMSAMTKQVDAIFIPQDNTIASAFATVVSSSKAAKVPLYSSVDTMVKEGSVASISQSQYQLGVETGKQIKELMKGKKVSQVPVKVIDEGKAVINEKVVNELQLSISDSLAKKSTIIRKK
ncbi:tryptophan ABC transporter substrate-binding protein [Streptococcus catagoni]|uniref:tryptophan ABC transporter substrate-binding protein n=1 Tax=Streptococcus catagoni TaxID=2654874 RepID=UPI00140CC54E|nr:tryptophan ABC transporter substrate-binding protein [Streptococcus catagoni]